MVRTYKQNKRLVRRENGDKVVDETVFGGRAMVVPNSGEVNFGRRGDGNSPVPFLVSVPSETSRDDETRREARRGARPVGKAQQKYRLLFNR